MSVGLRARLLFGFALALGGCRGAGPPVPAPPAFGPRMDLPAPSPADEGRCLEVGASRVCWPADGGPPRSLPRPLPALETPGGWRCFGVAEARRCQPRWVGAGPWRCEPESGCRRAHPRRPDDGEWECSERSGVVLCRARGRSAGVIAGPPDPAWLCGGEPRICLDLSPDFPPEPDARGRRHRCRFPFAPGEPRACVPATELRRVGDACTSSSRCPEGTDCLAGRCLPRRAPAPGCWTDRDCPAGARCRLGSCEAGR